jgi:hypothetical protein
MSPRGIVEIREMSASVASSSATRARFLREIERMGLPRGPGPEALVTADEIDALPPTVKRYLGFMGVIGRPRAWSFRLGMAGTFRMKPSGAWLRCEAWQYNTRLEIARIFRMRLHIGAVFPVFVRDDYLHGGGHMRGRFLDVVPLAEAQVEEIAIGELVTYLNDAILFSPSILLGPEVVWSAVDKRCFDVSIADSGRTVEARVFVDERGAPVDFQTVDRFYQAPADAEKQWVRTPWRTPVEGYELVDGRPFPKRGRAVWHVPEGPFAYADFRMIPGSFAENVAPGE